MQPVPEEIHRLILSAAGAPVVVQQGSPAGAATDGSSSSPLASMEVLTSLFILHGNVLGAALSIVVNHSEPVVRLVSRDYHRTAYRVGEHVCFNGYCDCSAYRYQVLSRDAACMCKHLLAVDLLEACAQQQETLLAHRSSADHIGAASSTAGGVTRPAPRGRGNITETIIDEAAWVELVA